MCTYSRRFTTDRRKQARCLLSPEQSSTRHEFNKVLETFPGEFHGVIVNFFWPHMPASTSLHLEVSLLERDQGSVRPFESKL